MTQMQPKKTFGLVLSASTLKGDKVVNHQGEDLACFIRERAIRGEVESFLHR